MARVDWSAPPEQIITALEAQLVSRGANGLTEAEVAAALDLDAALKELGREVSDGEFARLTDGLAERYKEVKRHA